MFKLNYNRERVAEAKDLLVRWYNCEKIERTPFVYSITPEKSGTWLPAQPYNYCEAINDSEKAVEGQLLSIQHQFDTFPDCDYLPYMTLAYLGEGILASMYGAKQYIVEKNPPFTEGRFFKDIYEAQNIDNSIDFEKTEWCKILKEHVTRFVEATNGEIPVGSPDYQSPYGTATKLVPNEELILAMYDEPELVKNFLSVITDGIIKLLKIMEKWIGADLIATNIKVPVPQKTGIIIWDDYISVLNPGLHTQICAPFNKRLFNEFGQGHLHTCGPYFPGYVNACLECNPKSMDIITMRGTGKSREDLISFLEITRKRNILLFGQLTVNETSIFEKGTKQGDDELLEMFIRGGYMPASGGTLEKGIKFRETINRIGRK